MPFVGQMMDTKLWDQKGVLLIDFLERSATIIAAVHSATLEHLWAVIRHYPGLLMKGVLLLIYKANPHTVNLIWELLQHFWWENFDHLLCSPYLAPSDFHLFPAPWAWCLQISKWRWCWNSSDTVTLCPEQHILWDRHKKTTKKLALCLDKMPMS